MVIKLRSASVRKRIYRNPIRLASYGVKWYTSVQASGKKAD